MKKALLALVLLPSIARAEWVAVGSSVSVSATHGKAEFLFACAEDAPTMIISTTFLVDLRRAKRELVIMLGPKPQRTRMEVDFIGEPHRLFAAGRHAKLWMRALRNGLRAEGEATMLSIEIPSEGGGSELVELDVTGLEDALDSVPCFAGAHS